MFSKKICQNLLLFFILMLLFFLIGVFFIDYYTIKYGSSILGMDIFRAVDDMVVFNSDHYRTSVHPLFVILINPFGNILNLIIKNKNISSIIITSAIGSLNVLILKKYFEKLEISIKLKVIIILIYLFSTTTLIYSSIPESFVFGTFTLLLSHLVFSKIEEEKDFSDKNKFNKFFLYYGITMILCFGITITNYIPSLILLIGILLKLNKRYSKLKVGGIIILLTLSIVTLGNIFQKEIYKTSRLYFMPSSIINEFNFINIGDEPSFVFLKRKIFENKFLSQQVFNQDHLNKLDKLALDSNKKNLKLNKLESLIKNQVFYSLISPTPEVEKDRYIVFNVNSYKTYSIREKSVLFCWCLFLIMSLIFTIKDRIYKNYFILCCIFFNFILHSLYGVNENFLYSAHIFFLFILLFANSVKNIKKFFYNENIITILCLFILINIIYNNISFIFRVKELLLTSIHIL